MKVYVAGYRDWDGFEPKAVFVDKKSAEQYCDSNFTIANDIEEVEFYDESNHEWLKELF